MRFFAVVMVVAATVVLAACEASSTGDASSQLRDANVKVSGYGQVGGSVSPR